MSQLEKIRHTTEHVLMQAMEDLYGQQVVKAMGPATDEGFYFDFNSPPDFSISKDDFPQIEQKMQSIINQDLPITKEELSAKEAKKLFKNNAFKQEWIDQAKNRGEDITIYWTGEPHSKDAFVDLCKGPHLESTGQIKAFKLTSIAGAYWHGDENNPMLTRIYGTAFKTQAKLDDYLEKKEQAKKRDHKKLGQELDLFLFDETAPGSPYWLPNGMVILNELLNFWRKEHAKRGYKETATPLVNKKELWETSGHWDHYKEHMFIADMGENEVYGIKPMNCPNAMVIFKSKTRSYRDLPLRLSDSDILHRYELSGTLNGLLRVRSFRQDDSHNFITKDQIKQEFKEIMSIAELFYAVFDLDFRYRLGTRPKKYLGDKKTWNRAEKELKDILENNNRDYHIEKGGGAFYGPKIDIIMEDALGRDWQMGTIQLDFQIPRRFNLKYTNKEGEEETPVVIHRVIYGSIERFIGILIEHFAGAFPVWLAPHQVEILTISQDQVEYAQQILEQLQDQNLRVNLNKSDQSLSKKIRDAESQKVPYMLIIGDNEVKSQQVSVRQRGEQDLGTMSPYDFIKLINKKIDDKALE